MKALEFYLCVCLISTCLVTVGGVDADVVIHVRSGVPSHPMYFQRLGRCYYTNMAVPTTWQSARAHCTSAGYDLAAIETPDENEMLKSVLMHERALPVDTNTPYDQFWTSGNGVKDTVIWQATKSPVDYNDWESPPSDVNGYIMLARRHAFQWQLASSTEQAYPLCERMGCRVQCLNGGVCKCGDVCACPVTHEGPTCATKRPCSLKCDGDSQPSKDCRYCVCPTLTISGIIVVDNAKQPLSGVKLYDAKSPETHLAVSDNNGTIAVTGLCNGSDVILMKKSYDEQRLKLDEKKMDITLFEQARIVTGPQDTIGEVGKATTLCCKTAGFFRDVKWSFNGGSPLFGLVTSIKSNTIYFVQRLTRAYSGMYRCHVRGGSSVVVSEPARLTVVDAAKKCAAPGPNAIKIPQTCTKQGQPATTDVGTCTNQMCPSASCIGVQKEKKCCIPKSYSHEKISCGGAYTFPRVKVDQCQCGSCKDVGHVVTILGKVTMLGSNAVVKDALITFTGDDNEYKTDNFGAFLVDVRVTIPTRVVITVRDSEKIPRFAEHLSVLRLSQLDAPREVGVNPKVVPVHIQQFPRPLTYNPQIQKVSMVVFGLTASSGYEDADGNSQSGTVYSSVEVLDARNEQHILEAPGEFMTLRAGSQHQVKFQALFSVMDWVKKGDGNLVRVQSKISGTIHVFVSQYYAESGYGSIRNRLYSLNPTTAFWDEMGTHAFSGNIPRNMKYVGSFIPTASRNWFGVGVPQYGSVCRAKVSAYTGNSRRQRVGGVQIDSIQEYGNGNLHSVFTRSSSHFTRKDTTQCLHISCSGAIKQMRAVHTGKPTTVANLQDTAIDSAEEKRIGISLDQGNQLYRVTLVAGPNIGAGPFSYDDTLETCEKSGHSSGEFVFYTGFLPYEMTIRPSPIPTDTARNHLVWYNPTNHKACYTKAVVFPNTLRNLILSAMSRGGTNAEIKDQVLGIREDTIQQDRAKKFMVVCLEYKCSGSFDSTDGSRVDNTLVEISVKSDNRTSCSVNIVSPSLAASQKAISPSVSIPKTYKKMKTFQLYMNKNGKSVQGVYSATSTHSTYVAKNKARYRCLQGNTIKTFAVVFQCASKLGG